MAQFTRVRLAKRKAGASVDPAPKPDLVGPLVTAYQCLSVEEIRADLPRLDRDELYFVQLLEDVSGRRDEVLERIAELRKLLEEQKKSEKNGTVLTQAQSPSVVPAALAVDIGPGGLWNRKGRQLTRLALRIAAVVVVSAGAGVVAVRGGTRLALMTTAASATPTPLARTDRPTRSAGDPLAGFFVAAPAGYIQQPDDPSRSGPADLAKAVTDDGTAGAQSILSRDGFVHGFRRTWRRGDPAQIVVWIYQFKDPGGAGAYARDLVSRVQAASGFQVAGFPVAALPGAVGLTSTATGDVTATVIFTKRQYLVRVAVSSVSDTGLAATGQQLAGAQYSRL